MSKTEKKKMKLWKKILLIAVITLLALILAAGIAVYALFQHYYNKTTFSPLGDDTFVSVPDETDFPRIPQVSGLTDPSGHTPNLPSGTGDFTDPTVSFPPYNPLPSSEIGKLDSDIEENNGNDYTIPIDRNITNILLIGTDGRTVAERGRSDSMILVTINRNTKQIVMTSFLRDIYLQIPGLALNNRINAAYSHGGPTLLLQTIEENFKLHIDKYVRINFFGFEKVVDRLGGLDIKLSQAEINYLGLQKTATPGVVHLNGAKVLQFCRCRHVNRDGFGSDFARAYRQREVMGLIYQKVKGSSLATLNDLLDEFLPQVVHNLEQSEIMELLFRFSSYTDYEIKSYQIPANGTWKYATIRQMAVTTIDFKKNIEMLEKYINGTA